VGDGLVEDLLIGCLNEFVDEFRREHVPDPETGYCRSSAHADEQVRLARARVTDQAERFSGADPAAAGEGVDRGGADGRVGIEVEVASIAVLNGSSRGFARNGVLRPGAGSALSMAWRTVRRCTP
jgi:hypothetical protein